MDLLPLIIFVLIIGFVAIGLDRFWQSYKQRQEASLETTGAMSRREASETPNDSFVVKLTGRIRAWRQRIGQREELGLGEKFHRWSSQSLTQNQTLKSWLDSLPAEALEGFTQQLDEFCTQMGFELTWLLDHQVDQSPPLAQMLTDVVIDYSRACRTAALAQADIAAFKLYHTFQQSPYEKTHHAFAQKLFAYMVEHDLTPAMPPHLLRTAEQERQVYIVQSIRQVAEQQPTVFALALRDMLLNGTAPTPSASSAA